MSNHPSKPWILEFHIEDFHPPVRVPIRSEIVLGRSVPDEAVSPQLDLTSYGGREGGVSRHHAVIFVEDDRLVVVDLGSPNGTHLNGVRLDPDIRYSLLDESELRVGRLSILVRVVSSPVPVRKSDSRQTAKTKRPGSGQMIHIVEDDVGQARALEQLVQNLGFRTHISHSALAAIRAYSRSGADAVLLDLWLPDMPGLEFCRYIRRDASNNTTPVIVMSADTSAESKNSALQAGVNVYLPKPLTKKDLLEVVVPLATEGVEGFEAEEGTTILGTAPLEELPVDTRGHSVVCFVVGFADTPLAISVPRSISFGRSGRIGTTGHIDLAPYNASNLGVSRTHMRLSNEFGGFYIEDLESSNGTYINEERLEPHKPVQLVSGDCVRLGQLRMFVYFMD